MKRLLIGAAIAAALSSPVVLSHTAVIADQRPADLNAIFNGNYHINQTVDFWNNVSRTAIDESGHVIGTQVGTYDRSKPNGMTVELTYLQPDATHPRGQAFDGDGNPSPLH